MTPNSLLAVAAALFSGILAVAAPARKWRSPASWCFLGGMGALAVESALGSCSLDTNSPEKAAYWQTLAFMARSFLPGFWLSFSLIYSRGNFREFLIKWRHVLVTAFLFPIALTFYFRNELIHILPRPEPGHAWLLSFGPPAKVVNFFLLISTIVILMNLENTFRAAVGIMRWRIKFLILGLAVVFGARIYTESQALLFSGYHRVPVEIEAGALLIGCVLMAVGYLRSCFNDIDVYPSQAILQTSVTVLLAGGYLLAVGVLAQIVSLMGGAQSFRVQAFLILVGIAVLAVLLLSDRLRQRIQRFVSRHFKRPQHDFRKVWTLFTQRMSSVLSHTELSSTAAKLISETFNILSVTIWLTDDRKGQLVFGASTSLSEPAVLSPIPESAVFAQLLSDVQKLRHPFDLEKTKEEWAEVLKRINTTRFPGGGNRIAVPLLAGDRCLGLAVLADRVNGLPYTFEELDLLKCIGDQLATGILNIRLTEELMQARELEAFQSMSAFFVHDLKNAASGLNLMLQNLPVHFDDPAFRKDALQGIGNTVKRINQLIARLSVLRNKLELRPVESDLNQLVTETLQCLNGEPGIEVVKEMSPLPKIVADREQFQNVVTNLLFNARDAVGNGGRIRVETGRTDDSFFLAVSDNGCGMSPAFLAHSLFRPFKTTKKKGLGIGMFESKMIVEAHGGNIQVESEPGKGTTFKVSLPMKQRST